MKKWVRPLTEVQNFVANEYVAACGETNKVYKMKCNAPAGDLYYYPNRDGVADGVHNGKGGFEYAGDLTPCTFNHEYSVTDVFYDGFVDSNENRKPDEGEGVIARLYFFLGMVENGHATKELDINSWETAKS